jgi:integrase
LGLVFPTERGKVQTRKGIAERGWQPAQLAAGVTASVFDNHGRPKRDQHGKPKVTAKYPGLHALRHFYASWCINRKVDGGRSYRPSWCRNGSGTPPSP